MDIDNIYICEVCGYEYELTPIYSNKKFCNRLCKAIFISKRNKKRNIPKPPRKDEFMLCEREGCDNVFIKTQSNHKYCSKKCCTKINKKKYNENKKITHYSVFEHDNFQCQYCGKTPRDKIKLVVDHIYPASKGGSSERFNLTTSCEECNVCKNSILLSIEETIRRWDINPEEFDFEAARVMWENIHNNRGR